MIGAYVRRGVAAGLVAGVLAGVFGFFFAEPALDAAIAVEVQASAAHAAGHDSGATFTRGQQKAGLVFGYALIGAAVGSLFGLASAWAVGRVRGDGWTRSLKLGAVCVAALVVLPAAKYPPNPPGVGDPETVGARTVLYLALAGAGLLLAVAAWTGARQIAGDMWAPARQFVVGATVAAAAALMLTVLPAPADGAGEFPAELLWRFRLGALATQATLLVAVAAVFGLLTARRETHDRRVGASC